ncbi:MAG: ribosome maturation factor RimP [Bacillota bacterium]
MPAAKKIVDAVVTDATPVAEALGLELVDVDYRKEGGRWFLRVYIDKPGGVGLQDCEVLSERLSRMLDEKNLIPHAYFFEVSSPGVERPLKKPADYVRFTGRDAQVLTTTPVNGRRKFTGTIVAAEEGLVRLAVDGSEVEIPYGVISKARLVFRW